MKPISLAGIVLIVLGLAALAYQGITYTTRDTVIDLGPIHATAEREKTIPLPPILGIAAVAAGVGVVGDRFQEADLDVRQVKLVLGVCVGMLAAFGAGWLLGSSGRGSSERAASSG
jgi:hypothetical protein